MKKAFLIGLLALTFSANSALAETICGEISFEDPRFYITMGNVSAQLAANDSLFFKPRRDLTNAIGTSVCVTGDWYDHYLFEVLRVEK